MNKSELCFELNNTMELAKYLGDFEIKTLDKMDIYLLCNNMKIYMSKKTNDILMKISGINYITIKWLNNLPLFINILILDLDRMVFLDNCIENLPINIKKIIININFSISYLGANYEYISFVKKLKLPFNCCVEICNNNKFYKVMYGDTEENELEIYDMQNNINMIIKRHNYKL